MAAELVKAFFIGIIQGITEWLPVSSTGHMLLFDRAFRLSLGERELVLFLTLIQLFSALAVVILGFRDIFPFLVRGSGKEQSSRGASSLGEDRRRKPSAHRPRTYLQRRDRRARDG